MLTLGEPSAAQCAPSTSVSPMGSLKRLIILGIMLLLALLGDINRSRIRNHILLFLSSTCRLFGSLGFTALVAIIVFLFLPFQLAYIH